MMKGLGGSGAAPSPAAPHTYAGMGRKRVKRKVSKRGKVRYHRRQSISTSGYGRGRTPPPQGPVIVLTHHGKVSRLQITAFVTRNIGKIRACAGALGAIVVRLKIDANGRIQSVLPVAATQRRATVSRCVLKALKAMHFGKQSGITEVRLLIQL